MAQMSGRRHVRAPPLASAVLTIARLACVASLLVSTSVAGDVAVCSSNTGLSDDQTSAMGADANSRLGLLSQISELPGELTRTFLSQAHRNAGKVLKRWMEEAGLRAWEDSLGNVHGRVEGGPPNTPALVLGSHYDTVRDGGSYDGALGIIVGLSALKALVASGAVLRQPVELIAFSDEEGVRFHTTFLGSRAVTGKLNRTLLTAAIDREGVSLGQALAKNGLDASDAALDKNAAPPGSVGAYVEVHIEQGPVLEAAAVPLGVVTAIAGQTRLLATVQGEQGHAGTVPMALRRDPMPGVAEAVVYLERRCSDADGGAAAGLVCTVGEVHTFPGASNVIAGRVEFTMDIRSKSDTMRQEVVTDTITHVLELCKRRGLTCTAERKHDADALQCDPQLIEAFAAAAAPENAAAAPAAAAASADGVPRIVSGAGHDGLAMGEIAPVGMLFVRCRGGISHNPAEHVEPKDVAAATAALLRFLRAYSAFAQE